MTAELPRRLRRSRRAWAADKRFSMRSFPVSRPPLPGHLQGSFKHMVIHSDSTSAIARAGHSGTGPGQRIARDILKSVKALAAMSRSVQLVWVKGHSGVPANEKADMLAGQEAEKAVSSSMVSITSLKLQISQRYNAAKEKWSKNPAHRGKDSITPPPPKKSCLDGAKNGLARVASQIRSGHLSQAH
jgi:hypothetical protein